jgi:C4-dicarboxylate transporter
LEEQWAQRDDEHLKALAIGHYVLAVLSLLTAAQAVIFGSLMAKAVNTFGSDLTTSLGDVTDATGMGSPVGDPVLMIAELETFATGLTTLFTVSAVITAIGFGLVGWKLRQKSWWTFCYLTGWGELLLFPFGTILGIFTIVVLSRPSVKALFGVD